jgi:hypothetical protein
MQSISNESAIQPYTMLDAYQYSFHSALLDRSFDISVALPPSYNSQSRAHPAIFVLDGQTIFGTAAELSRALASSGETADLIVIGIGIPAGKDVARLAARRLYEFSLSTEWTFTDSFGTTIKNMMGALGLEPHTAIGGGPLLLASLRDEILPSVANRYRISTSELGLFGASAAGNFALYALLSGDSPFTKYICSSPATAYNDSLIMRIEEDFAKEHRDLAAELFLAAGSDEMSDAFIESAGVVSGVAHLSGRFAKRNYPGFRIRSRIFSGEGHMSAVAPALTGGLRMLWPGTSSLHQKHADLAAASANSK